MSFSAQIDFDVQSDEYARLQLVERYCGIVRCRHLGQNRLGELINASVVRRMS